MKRKGYGRNCPAVRVCARTAAAVLVIAGMICAREIKQSYAAEELQMQEEQSGIRSEDATLQSGIESESVVPQSSMESGNVASQSDLEGQPPDGAGLGAVTWESEWEETEWTSEQTQTEWESEQASTEWETKPADSTETEWGTEPADSTETVWGTESAGSTETEWGTEPPGNTETEWETERMDSTETEWEDTQWTETEWEENTGGPQTEWPQSEEETQTEWQETENTDLSEWTEDTGAPQTDATEGESLPETESETETEEKIPVLADTNGSVEAEVFAGEENGFPKDARLCLLTIEDIITQGEDAALRCQEWKDALLSDYQLTEEEAEQVEMFLPYYLMAIDGEGNEISLQGQAEVRFVVRDEAVYEKLLAGGFYRVGDHHKGDEFTEIEEKEVSCREEEHLAEIRFPISSFGWVSILQLPEEEAEDETEELELIGLDGIAAYAANDSTGMPVTNSGSGFILLKPENVDTAFRPVKWYSGQSSLELFNSAGANVQVLDGASYNMTFSGFYPRNNSAKGKFGAIYHKVLFCNGVYYDMKMTVVNYTDKTWVGSTKVQEHAAFPPILFSKKAIVWRGLQRLGEVVLKIEFFKNGDSAQTPVRQNIRMQWYDIDAHQRFGIRTGDGTISKKYYQTADCVVHYSNERSRADTANSYLYLTATPALSGSDLSGNVGFALENCSTYYMAFGYLDHLDGSGESTATRLTSQRLEEILDALEKGDVSLAKGDGTQSSYDELVQLDLETAIPMDEDYPKKYVSNDGKSWSEENMLPKINSEYYYKIEQYVPGQPPTYSYTKFEISDTLPAGADYVGEMKILCEENGADVTGRFHVQAENDRIRISPVDLSAADFMGYHFMFIFKVKMDISEISPTSGGSAPEYVVQNAARTEAAMKNYGKTFSNDSNKVTTRADARPIYAHLRLTKEIDTADIVWAHGNPTFTFRVTGEDIYGKTHTYYETVEFTPQNAGGGPKSVLTADIRVVAGWYKAAEEKTMRYALQSIHSVTGGTAAGSEAVFDVSETESAGATFYNVKTTDEGEGHTAFARNTIKGG